MRWEDERYVRLYTRNTVDWHFLSFEAQGLMTLLLRVVDRAGLLPLGRHGRKGVAAAIGHPGRLDAIEPALEELLTDGCVQITDDESHLLIPNFVEAQEATASDRARQQKAREVARDLAAAQTVTNRDSPSQNVTKSHAPSRAVTDGHAASQAVTPNRAVPCLAVPSRAEPGEEAASPPPLNSVADSLGDRMQVAFAKAKGASYAWTRRDDDALRQLARLSSGDDDEVLRRWEIALAWVGFPLCASLRDLAEKWNAYAQPQARAGPVRDVKRGRVGAEEIDKAAFSRTGTVDDF